MQPLVLGAAGFIGLNLVDALLAQGVQPRCGRRRRTNVLALRQRKVPMVEAYLDQPESLVAAMSGCDVVFHCAGHYPRLSVDRDAIVNRGVTEIRNVLHAAATAGIRRLVYVSSTATVAPRADGPSTERDVYAEPPGFGPYHDVKWHMEREVLAERRFEAIIACPSGCIGPWDMRVGTSAILVALARGLNPPHPDGFVNLVDARDVGLALTRIGVHESPAPRILLAPPQNNYRFHDLLTELAPRYGASPPCPPLSDAEARRLADEEEARVAREGGRPGLSREIVDLVVHGVSIDSPYATDHLGMHWTALQDTLGAFESWARGLRIIP